MFSSLCFCTKDNDGRLASRLDGLLLASYQRQQTRRVGKPAESVGSGVAVLSHVPAGNNLRDEIWDGGPTASSFSSCGTLPELTVQ